MLPSCFRKSREGICDLYLLFSNSSGTVFEFVVTDGDILNFDGSKQWMLALKSTTAPAVPALDTCQVCPSSHEELYSGCLDLQTSFVICT